MDNSDALRQAQGERQVYPDKTLDCYGLLCPMPIRKTAEMMDQLNAGQILKIIATDEWFGPDLEAWLRHHPHQLIAFEQTNGEFHATLRK